MRSWFERLFGKTAGEAGGPANDAEDLQEEMRDFVRREVRAGFEPTEAIVAGAIDMFTGEADAPFLTVTARRLVSEEMAALAAEERVWPATTDCDRLDVAFAALERRGVVARQHFTCCGTCGSAEIWDEIRSFEASGEPARGYAFYHWQDTEAAVDGYGMFLNYGACDDGEAAALAVARDIVAELERHGLKTEWNGSWDKRIGVMLDWKRRRSPESYSAAGT